MADQPAIEVPSEDPEQLARVVRQIKDNLEDEEFLARRISQLIAEGKIDLGGST